MNERSGAGGAAPSTSLRSYTLVEIELDGREGAEVFSAPDDDRALERALAVGRGSIVELWCGPHLIRRWAGRTRGDERLP